MCHEVLPKGVNKSNPIGWFDQCEATEKSHGTYQGLGSPVCQRKLDIWIVDIGSGAQLPGNLVEALGIVFYFAWVDGRLPRVWARNKNYESATLVWAWLQCLRSISQLEI